MSRATKRCRLGAIWHPATAKPRLLLHAVDDHFADLAPDRLTLDLPVCHMHRDRAVELIRDSWAEIVGYTRRARAPIPDATRVGVEWIPIQ